jgi:hypothetical protein
MIVGVALVVAGKLAAVEPAEIGEGLRKVAGRVLLVQPVVDAADFPGYVQRLGGVDAVGNVVIVTPLDHCILSRSQITAKTTTVLLVLRRIRL